MPSSASVGSVSRVCRYPVKSMLGETLSAGGLVTERGLEGDRRWAVVDAGTGRVGSAKRPQAWQRLLHCSAALHEGANAVALITLPDGRLLRSDDAAVDRALSVAFGRSVRLMGQAPADGLEIERSRPEEVLAQGFDGEVAMDIGRLGRAAPEGSFFDYAPIHLLTTGSLAALQSAGPSTPAPGEAPYEMERYRPNLVIDTGASSGFIEDEWVGQELTIGATLRLRVLLPTPRCAIPMLPQGRLPARRDAFARLKDHHRVALEGIGVLPCLGVYAEVLQPGEVRPTDEVRLHPSR